MDQLIEKDKPTRKEFEELQTQNKRLSYFVLLLTFLGVVCFATTNAPAIKEQAELYSTNFAAIGARLDAHGKRIARLEGKVGISNGKTFKTLPSSVSSGWVHVRHVPSGFKWHPGNDDAKGTFQTGKPSSSVAAAAWAVKFNYASVRQYLFMTGNGRAWTVMDKAQTNGNYVSCFWRTRKAVSTHVQRNGGMVSYAYCANSAWTPMVYSKVANGNCAYQVYQESNWGYCSIQLRQNQGADVYVRFSTHVAPARAARGMTFSKLPSVVSSGWTHVRHVPAGNNWHSGNDDIKGTFSQGTPSNAANAARWAKTFNFASVKQYLFMNPSGSRWVVLNRDVTQTQTGGSWRGVPVVKASSGHSYVKLANTASSAWQPQLTTHNQGGCAYNIYYEANATWCANVLRSIGGADVYVR